MVLLEKAAISCFISSGSLSPDIILAIIFEDIAKIAVTSATFKYLLIILVFPLRW